MGAGLLLIFGLIAFLGLGTFFLFFRLPAFDKQPIKYRRGESFTPLEEKVLRQFLKKSEEEARQVLKEQLSVLEMKHRFYEKQKLLLELRTRDDTVFPNALRLNDKHKFHSEIINFSIKKTSFKSWLTFVNGQISEMTIIPNPKKYEKSNKVLFA